MKHNIIWNYMSKMFMQRYNFILQREERFGTVEYEN